MTTRPIRHENAYPYLIFNCHDFILLQGILLCKGKWDGNYVC